MQSLHQGLAGMDGSQLDDRGYTTAYRRFVLCHDGTKLASLASGASSPELVGCFGGPLFLLHSGHRLKIRADKAVRSLVDHDQHLELPRSLIQKWPRPPGLGGWWEVRAWLF
jgi:hypothetical protein